MYKNSNKTVPQVVRSSTNVSLVRHLKLRFNPQKVKQINTSEKKSYMTIHFVCIRPAIHLDRITECPRFYKDMFLE